MVIRDNSMLERSANARQLVPFDPTRADAVIRRKKHLSTGTQVITDFPI